MKTIFSVLVLLVALGASAAASPVPVLPKADASWEKVGESDGVLTHRKEVEGSDVVAFRGETVIDAPIAKISNVLIDTSRKKEWVFRIVEARDVRQLTQFERIEYNHTASGFFMVRDRDFVFRAKGEFDRAKNQATFTFKSVEDTSVPEQGPVRGDLKMGKYTLTMLSPTKTHVVVEILADPKGSVPKWLVNLFQKSWPVKTLNGIREQCKKADVAENQAIKAYFAQADIATSPTAATKALPTSAVKKRASARGAEGVPGALK